MRARLTRNLRIFQGHTQASDTSATFREIPEVTALTRNRLSSMQSRNPLNRSKSLSDTRVLTMRSNTRSAKSLASSILKGSLNEFRMNKLLQELLNSNLEHFTKRRLQKYVLLCQLALSHTKSQKTLSYSALRSIRYGKQAGHCQENLPTCNKTLTWESSDAILT